MLQPQLLRWIFRHGFFNHRGYRRMAHSSASMWSARISALLIGGLQELGAVLVISDCAQKVELGWVLFLRRHTAWDSRGRTVRRSAGGLGHWVLGRTETQQMLCDNLKLENTSIKNNPNVKIFGPSSWVQPTNGNALSECQAGRWSTEELSFSR
jgi:hypothetical protein